MSYDVQNMEMAGSGPTSLVIDANAIVPHEDADRKVTMTFVSPGFASFTEPNVLVERKNSDGTWSILRGQ